MNLAIDIGNSRVKVGLFVEKRLLQVHAFGHEHFSTALLAVLEGDNLLEKVKYLGCASVGNKEILREVEWLAESFPGAELLMIDSETPLPVTNAYRSPSTLGMDRICACAGARTFAPDGPLLVIDAGTAITYDYLDGDSHYQGGGIAPGMRLRFRSLNDHTAALPLVEAAGDLPLVGYDTLTSIRSGVVNGLLAEIEGIVHRYRQEVGPSLKAFLTGGDAGFLGNHLKNINFVDPNLLLYGIHAVTTYNLSNAT